MKANVTGGQRIALRINGVVRWLATDHLGSTALTVSETGGRMSEIRYKPWGESRYTFGATPTQRRFTGQVLDEVAGGLYFYNARYYDPYLNRWIQPDSIIPNPGDPQNLNRYSYCRNNPLRFIDPSGHDPLDQAWQDEFEQMHHRAPTAEDILIRLFSIAFPGEWNWSVFYDADGNYVQGNLESVFRDNRPANWSWNDMPSALERLTGWYKAGEEGMFTRDIGSLFGGLANRLEAPNAWPAVSNAGNPIRTWVYFDRQGLPASFMGTSDDDANVHHWAWALTMGAEYGPGGSLLNTGREITQFHGDWRNSWSDVSIGNRGAALGVRFRVLGLTDITHAWNFFMLDRWF